MKIQIYEDAAHLWRWRAVAENGRIIADGAEGYDSASNAARGVDTVRDGFTAGDLRVEHLEADTRRKHEVPSRVDATVTGTTI
jgi:uncharacterized protein YegP (UPF0339 family)